MPYICKVEEWRIAQDRLDLRNTRRKLIKANDELAALRAVLEAARAENERLRELLRTVNEAAAYDIQFGSEGSNTYSIEAISRAALEEDNAG